ncbi:MAG: tRNA pseudouridine(55) synthase TruB [Vulcanibacillus sp.]
MSLNIDGILPINKSAGMTSHDVVAKLRRILGIKKIGHTGTLDPDVTGVLPICIGKATRLSDYLMEMPKTYKCQLTFGISTVTQDFSGEITENVRINNFDIKILESVIRNFVGEIEQVPPMYSSVKVDGKKLYELAREGKEITRKPRKITIYSIDIEKIDISKDYPEIDFTVKCSKGTYIRTLCVDIGLKMGYPAHMSKLQRTESGSFKIENSYTIEDVEDYLKGNKLDEIIFSMADSLPSFNELILSNEDITNKIFNGQTIFIDELESYEGTFKILNKERDLIALYEKEKNYKYAKPLKVFK